MEREQVRDHTTTKPGKTMDGPYAHQTEGVDIRHGLSVKVTTTGWRPTCAHDAGTVPGVTLDPFAGTGTVGMVAQKLSRRAVLIDLNGDYLDQLRTRNQQAPLGLAQGVA